MGPLDLFVDSLLYCCRPNNDAASFLAMAALAEGHSGLNHIDAILRLCCGLAKLGSPGRVATKRRLSPVAGPPASDRRLCAPAYALTVRRDPAHACLRSGSVSRPAPTSRTLNGSGGPRPVGESAAGGALRARWQGRYRWRRRGSSSDARRLGYK